MNWAWLIECGNNCVLLGVIENEGQRLNQNQMPRFDNYAYLGPLGTKDKDQTKNKDQDLIVGDQLYWVRLRDNRW